MPPVLEVQERPTSRIAVTAAQAVCLCLLVGFIWAALSPRPTHVVMHGKIIPSGRVQVIEPLEPATVKSIHVRNGDVVTQEDVLLTFDPTEIEADRDRLKRELETANADVARLQATLDALNQGQAPADDLFEALPAYERTRQQNFLDATMKAREARMAALASDEKRYQEQIRKLSGLIVQHRKSTKAAQSKLVSFEKLQKNGHMPLSELLAARQEAATANATLIDTRGNLKEAREALKGIAQQRTELLKSLLEQAHRELAEAQSRQRSAEQELIKAAKREARSRLAAPVDGIVANLAVHTVGDVVQTGERLMVIVPRDAELEIEVLMKNRDWGNAWLGQEARIKVEAFPFTKYGVLPGEIVHISPDAVDVEGEGLMFPVRVRLDKSTIFVRGHDMQLGPGMRVTVEARAGSQTVLQYMITPLARIADQAMRER